MKPRARIKRTLVVTALLALAGGAVPVAYFAGRARAAGIPTIQPLSYSGVLTDASGTPLSGSKNIQLIFFDAAVGGNVACATSPASKALVAGAFHVALPDECVTAVRTNANLWVEVFVDAASVGRTKLAAVPYAIEAGEASCGIGITGMIDTGAGFCIDATDRGREFSYGSAIGTCAMEGKVVCSFVQLCTAQLRGVGGLSATVDYRVSDLMYYEGETKIEIDKLPITVPPGDHYFGGGHSANALIPPAGCTVAAPGPSAADNLMFRCCRGKG